MLPSVSAVMDLLVILHQPAELFRSAENSQRISGMERARIGGMHFRLVVMPEQDNIEMIIIFHITDGFIRQV